MSLSNIITLPRISMEEASGDTGRWQDLNPDMKAFLFHRNELECMKNETGSVGIRFYMGLTNLNAPEMLVVGVNERDEDIIDETGPNSKIYNFALPCPPTCDNSSPLMHNPIPLNFNPGVRGQSPSTTCEEALEEVSFADAFIWTENWQEKHSLKSALFSIQELIDILDEYGDQALRVYFGIKVDGSHNLILIGTDQEWNDIAQPTLYESMALCTTENTLTCAIGSPLCHGCT